MKPFYPTSLKTTALFLSLMIISGLAGTVTAQQLTINPRSSLVLNGSVSLVINNSAFQNYGTFSAGASTVSFTGHNDTLVSYVNGNQASEFNNLSISKSANGVALKSRAIVINVLTVDGGNLYTDSNLTLKSDVNLTARVAPVAAASQIIGKADVERFVPSKRSWRLMTAPVTNSNTIYNTWQNAGVYTPKIGLLVTGPSPTGATGNGLDPSAQNTVSMKSWNYSTQAFVNVVNTKIPLSAGNTGSADNTGYFIFVRGDRDASNTCTCSTNTTTITGVGALQTGTQTFPAAAVSGKYTLIGNPYASPVNFENIARTNLVKRFYTWDPSLNQTGGYVMMDDLDGDGVYRQIPASAQTIEFQSGQAFFVETKIAGAASITFNESSKSTNRSNMGFRPAGNPSGIIKAILNLVNTDNSVTIADGTFAEFNSMFSSGIDRDDALKFGNSNENLSIARNGISLAAERRPELNVNDTIYFKLATTTQRAYQFVFEADNLQQPGLIGYLMDSYLETSTLINLNGSTEVNFNINAVAASAATNRFKMVFKQATVLPVTITSVKAYQLNKDIAVEWTVENEINMIKYDVEKSTDGTSFSYVSNVKVTGTNNLNNTYSWLDVKPVQGGNYYRIKSYDLSGQVKYSNIVKVSITTGVTGYSIYPNPVTTNVINLVITNQPAGKYHVSLTNVIGQVIFVKDILTNGGTSSQALKTESKLVSGVYQLEISSPDNSHDTQKVIVE